MKALILVAGGVEDMEFYYPFYRLKEAGIPVDVAGPEKGKVHGKHGYPVDINESLSSIHADDYDLLILPGGKSPETVRLYSRALEVTRQMMEAGKCVAAICHGGQVLVSADVLKGRRATCYKAIRDDLKAAGATYVDEEVVVDGNLITSRVPDDLPAFFREINNMCAAHIS
ncbi:Putative cysteine protease YraA [Anaerohalosphaera lusitana]|uniref:Putative cysteine protease YraA n=1 Tax=Anaerohalosphaera lusitana TaxID=1936003 RepID=A0A1U9NQC9_9BACT|nr:type 1 glutamine amidotransferase domain-containing protein [Anaerohalosphaera lusitana]AQT70141.1 Putative cysteine protease YraA [Anaerohalosphaera lusitana]